jgi:hypothetical protein
MKLTITVLRIITSTDVIAENVIVESIGRDEPINK